MCFGFSVCLEIFDWIPDIVNFILLGAGYFFFLHLVMPSYHPGFSHSLEAYAYPFFFFFIILLGIYHVNLGSLSLKYLYKTSSAYCCNNLEGRKEKYFPSTLLSFLAGTLK